MANPDHTFPPHEWGPDPNAPGFTHCLWCHRKFVHAAGTRCEVDQVTRAETTPMPAIPEPDHRPRMLPGVVMAAVMAAAVLAILTAATVVVLRTAGQ